MKYNQNNVMAICKKFFKNDYYCDNVALPELLYKLGYSLWYLRFELEVEEEICIRKALYDLHTFGVFYWED